VVALVSGGLEWQCWRMSPHRARYTFIQWVFGCEACWGRQWLQLQWPRGLEEWLITWKELLPVVIACMTWGSSGGNKESESCDNAAVVEIMKAAIQKNLTFCTYYGVYSL